MLISPARRSTNWPSTSVDFFQHLVYGPTVHDLAARTLRIESRENAFREITHDPDAALREFHVRYIALAGNQRLPDAVAPQFALLQNGPDWIIWERKAIRDRTAK